MINRINIEAKNLILLSKLTKGELIILSELLKIVSLDGDYKEYIILNSSIRKQIIENLNIASATFNNALNALSKKGFITREDTNMYKPNKNIFDFQ